MKRHVILLSVIAALALTGCQLGPTSEAEGDDSSSEKTPSTSKQDSSSSQQSSKSTSTFSWEDDYQEHEEETITGSNFTITIPADLSSMSENCKKYVDDMRAQQRRLRAQFGEDADYKINDLYGLEGVDLTKGVVPSTGNYQDNSGGYRDGTTQNDYLDPVGANWENGEKSDESKGITITFTPSAALQNKTYKVTYGKKADLSDGEEIDDLTTTSVNIKNLLVNQKYYFKVEAEGQSSDIVSFTTGDYPRWIDARPMFNVRDMGGYLVKDGNNGLKRIKQGLVYRGGEINKKTGWYGSQRYTDDTGNTQARDGHIVTETEAAGNVFRDNQLVIETKGTEKIYKEGMGMAGGLEIDLRGSGETNGYPTTKNVCDFSATGESIAYKIKSISSYANGMKNGKTLIKDVFNDLANVDTTPVYYHCYGGADRTGTIGFLLGAVLGMSYTDLVIDFELTSYSSNPSRNYRSHLRNGPWNEWPGLMNYLKNDLGWSNKTIRQGAEDYLKSCGVTDATISAIRTKMLEPAE